MLGGLGVLADFLGVPTLVHLLGRSGDKLGAKALDLLRGLRPNVVGVDDGTEPTWRWRSLGDRRRQRRG